MITSLLIAAQLAASTPDARLGVIDRLAPKHDPIGALAPPHTIVMPAYADPWYLRLPILGNSKCSSSKYSLVCTVSVHTPNGTYTSNINVSSH